LFLLGRILYPTASVQLGPCVVLLLSTAMHL
jgi:hypothetical protein